MVICSELSCIESAILNRESGDSIQSRESNHAIPITGKVAVSIDRMRFGWRF